MTSAATTRLDQNWLEPIREQLEFIASRRLSVPERKGRLEPVVIIAV